MIIFFSKLIKKSSKSGGWCAKNQTKTYAWSTTTGLLADTLGKLRKLYFSLVHNKVWHKTNYKLLVVRSSLKQISSESSEKSTQIHRTFSEFRQKNPQIPCNPPKSAKPPPEREYPQVRDCKQAQYTQRSGNVCHWSRQLSSWWYTLCQKWRDKQHFRFSVNATKATSPTDMLPSSAQ